jgi:hypothetical protein
MLSDRYARRSNRALFLAFEVDRALRTTRLALSKFRTVPWGSVSLATA